MLNGLFGGPLSGESLSFERRQASSACRSVVLMSEVPSVGLFGRLSAAMGGRLGTRPSESEDLKDLKTLLLKTLIKLS